MQGDSLAKRLAEGKMYPIQIKMHLLPVTFVRFNLDGTMFLTCSNDGKVNVHCARTGDLLDSFENDDGVAVKSFDITMDSKFIIVPTFIGDLYIYSLEEGEKYVRYATPLKTKACQLSFGDKDFIMVGLG